MLREDFRLRSRIVTAGCVIFASAVFFRAAVVQLGHDPRLEQMAKHQFQTRQLVRPRRGSILDRNGQPLAISVETHSLAANPLKVKNKKSLAFLLSKATGISSAKILERLKEQREFVWIKRQLNDEQLLRFKKWRIMNQDDDLVEGLWLIKESQRIYPHGELASQVLGGVNVDSMGLEGVELELDEQLSGKVVSVNAVRDALGRPTFIDADTARAIQDGENISLSIDASLQFSVEHELKNAVYQTGAKGGTVIVMNAVNGEILAMVNDPAFNPKDRNASPDRRRNRAVTDGYEPGSTLKAVLLASALSHGSHLTDRLWGGLGEFEVQGKKISEAESKEKFEWLSLKKIIAVSSNIGAAKLALKLGADNYLAALKVFGFGSKTGSGFPGEISGKIPPRKAWQPLTLANIGFGQGILVTALQMTRAYAAFLNEGWLVQPTLLKNENLKREAPERILSAHVSEEVLEALKAVLEDEGTGLKANLDGYLVAGKTGTAQKTDPASGAYSKSKFVSSFIGFALNVEPQIVIFTSLDEPKGNYYAAETAAPLFHNVLNAVANRFSFPMSVEKKVKLAQARTDHIQISQSLTEEGNASQKLHWEGSMDNGDFVWKMPSLQGLTAREALHILEGHHIRVKVFGSGLVTKQVPETGDTVAEGDTVHLGLAEPGTD